MKQCKINVTHLSKRNKATSASDSRPTAGKLLRCLHGYYLLPDHNPSFLMFCFSDIFLSFYLPSLSIYISFYLPSLSIYTVDLLISVLCTQIERFSSIITRHAPYCRLATSVFWDKITIIILPSCHGGTTINFIP